MSDGVTVSIEELIQLKALAQTRLFFPSVARSKQSGSYFSKIRGRGMEFSEVRNYQAGDDIRHMEWRMTARTGRPHVKLYHEERERPVLFITDFNPSLYFGTKGSFKSVLAARLTALLAWRALHQGDKVGGILFSANDHHEFSPHSRHAALMKFLACLAQYTQHLPRETPQTNRNDATQRLLSEVLLRARRVNTPGSLIFLISDFYALDAESDQHLLHLRQHNDVLAFHLYDQLETTLPDKGVFPFGSGDQPLVLDAEESSIAKDYQAFWKQRHEAIQHRIQRLGVIYSRVNATQDLTQVVAQTLPGRQHAI